MPGGSGHNEHGIEIPEPVIRGEQGAGVGTPARAIDIQGVNIAPGGQKHPDGPCVFVPDEAVRVCGPCIEVPAQADA